MSLRFQADNDLRFSIVKAVRRIEPTIDFLSARQSNLEGVSDPEILERVAANGRVLVSHDRRTMIRYFRDRLIAGKPNPGLLLAGQKAPLADVAEAIVLLWAANYPEEMRDRILHLPSFTRHSFTR